MKARIIEFNNETGKILKRGYAKYIYCTESTSTVNTPIIEIDIPDKRKTVDTVIQVPLRSLLSYLKKKKIKIKQKKTCIRN